MSAFLLGVAGALASPVAVSRADRMLAEVGATLAVEPAAVRPALDGWLEAGGDLASARGLLLSGGRRGCTGTCAGSLLSAGRDALVAGRSADEAVAIVLDAQHEADWLRQIADPPLTDAELGHEVRRATAERLRDEPLLP
jgi:hypothetical protein